MRPKNIKLSSIAAQLGLVWLVALVSLMLWNSRRILLSQATGAVNQELSNQSLSTFWHSTLRQLDSLPYINTLVLFFFWMLVGLLVYTLLVFLYDIFTGTETSLHILHDYRLPTGISRQKIVAGYIQYALLFASLTPAWIALAVALPNIALVANDFLAEPFRNPQEPFLWVGALGATLIFSLCILGLLWISLLLVRLWKIVFVR